MSAINFRSCWLVFFLLFLTVVFLSVSTAYAEDTFMDDTESEQFESTAGKDYSMPGPYPAVCPTVKMNAN